MATKNHKPVVMAVIPVRPPSRIPVADSMNTVTGEVPISDPATIATPSEQYARVLRGNNIDMRALLIRSINLPQDIKGAIEMKLTREQEALAMTYVNEKERLEAQRKLIEAEGIANYNREVSASLTTNILKLRGIEATLKLAESANDKVIVVGEGDDGLPLILGGNN